jgi:methylamine dehydrogenase accessory protein MauD
MIEALAVSARLVLATVLLVAGVSKLADPAGSRAAMDEFGVPARVSPLLGRLVPLLEIMTAAGLVSAAASWAAVGSVALLLGFSAAIAANLARGRHPQCHCFGQLHSAPAGVSALLRNGFLIGVAVFIWVWGVGDMPAPAWEELADLTALEVCVALITATALVILIVRPSLFSNALRRHPWVATRLDPLELRLRRSVFDYRTRRARARIGRGLDIGSAAPPFSLSDLSGRRMSLDALLTAHKPVLMLFIDAFCSNCDQLLPEIADWHSRYERSVTIVLISQGTAARNRAKVAAHDVGAVLLQEDREVLEAYRVFGTPGAVLVDSDGKISSGAAWGAEEIRDLVDAALVSRHAAAVVTSER